jgi:hypothetical protein
MLTIQSKERITSSFTFDKVFRRRTKCPNNFAKMYSSRETINNLSCTGVLALEYYFALA